MQVIIVGAGLSGVTTAIALWKYVQPKLKDNLEVTIYDAPNTKPTNLDKSNMFEGRSSPGKKDQGAAISLQPNGIKVLRDLDPRLADRVRACGFPCNSFTWKTAGHCAVGGILELDDSLPSNYLQDPSIVFIQSAVGVFGYCGASQADPKRLLYFSFYDSDLPQRGEKPDPREITKELVERHRNWADPIITQCMEKSGIDTIWPIFDLPDLPSWGRDGCVLIGGAGQAMTPATGQGGSQAFEDAQTLALLLRSYLEQHDVPGAIDSTINGLHAVRHERVYALKAKGLQMKEPERPWSMWTTLAAYGFFYLMTKTKVVMQYFGWTDLNLEWDAEAVVDPHAGVKSTK